MKKKMAGKKEVSGLIMKAPLAAKAEDVSKSGRTEPAPATVNPSASPPPKAADASTSPHHRGKESKSQPLTLFGDLPKPVSTFSGLFDLYEEADGSFRAEFGRKTAPIFQQLTWKLTASEWDLSKAILLLLTGVEEIELPEIPDPVQMVPFGRSNIGQIHVAAKAAAARADFFRHAVRSLRASMGKDLLCLTDEKAPAAAQRKAKKRLKNQFSHVLEALEKKSSRPAHSLTSQVAVGLVDGTRRLMPLAWVILDTARSAVEKTQQLPTKRDIRAAIVSHYRDAERFSGAQWSASLKECGLQGLDRAEDW